MVSLLYPVSALNYALVLGIILSRDSAFRQETSKIDKAYIRLIKWVIFFCVQDIFWGVSGSTLVKSDAVFFIASTIFHLSTVWTTYFWLHYVLTYLSDRIKNPRIYLAFDGIVIFAQVLMVIVNFIHPVIFTIEEGEYVTHFLRPVAFFNQYVVYLVIGAITLVCAIRERGEIKEKYRTVFLFALAPILSGVFQLLYPDGPFYSMGYFLGCFIIHIFIVSKDRDELNQLQNDIKMAEQIAISNTDELTGLYNRRAYEDEIRHLSGISALDDFVFASIDVNGLKNVNDDFGHQAGDELICGAAECIKQCLGPYGEVFRTGGDEFVALFNADKAELDRIKADFDETVNSWSGNLVPSLSVSVGYVQRSEFLGKTIEELVSMADKRMYEAKARYYSNRGVDRRGQQAAHKALCQMYAKILKANITEDSFQIISVSEGEMDSMPQSNKISEWFKTTCLLGIIHGEDADYFMEKTNLDYLRRCFQKGHNSIGLTYRKMCRGAYRRCLMEMIPADDYTNNNQTIFIFVKEIYNEE